MPAGTFGDVYPTGDGMRFRGATMLNGMRGVTTALIITNAITIPGSGSAQDVQLVQSGTISTGRFLEAGDLEDIGSSRQQPRRLGTLQIVNLHRLGLVIPAASAWTIGSQPWWPSTGRLAHPTGADTCR